MNDEFLEKVKALTSQCAERINQLPPPLSIIATTMIMSANGLLNGSIPLNEKYCFCFLELIVENHIDNPPVIEKILGDEIIKTANELYSQIKTDNQV